MKSTGEEVTILNKGIEIAELIKRIIEIASDEGDVVWDPFSGLCTTAIASIQLGRKCYCAEKSEEVFNVADNRVLSELENGL